VKTVEDFPDLELEFQKVFAEMDEVGILPPSVHPSFIYTTSGSLPYVGLPKDRDMPLQSQKKFVTLASVLEGSSG
jgi:hypothetical protein